MIKNWWLVFMDECQKLRTDFDYASMKFKESTQLFLDRDYFLNLKKLLDELLCIENLEGSEYMYEKLLQNKHVNLISLLKLFYTMVMKIQQNFHQSLWQKEV